MKKILDFIIIFLLVFLIINLFQDNNKKQAILQQQVILKTINDKYTVPASVKVEIQNNSWKELKINTCDNFEINFMWSDIKTPKSFCKDIIVENWKKTEIDYSKLYNLFEKVWYYTIKSNIGSKEYITNFEIENKWAFTKLFTWLFYAPAYNLMIFLIKIFSWSLGWAIVTITIFLRILLLWPQHKMMVSQRKLQALQPKIKEIQKKHKWNTQMLWVKTMELYKTEKVNPMWSCGFLLIQMPILLVIYNVIRYITDPSNHFYLYNFLKGFDFSSINYTFYGIDLLSSWWKTGIILGVFVWLIQFIQIKLSNNINNSTNKWVVLEKKKWENEYSNMMPDPEVMQKIMLYWMPVMIAIFTYNFPAWLWLYWGISTLFMIIQQLIVNKLFKKSS